LGGPATIHLHTHIELHPAFLILESMLTAVSLPIMPPLLTPTLVFLERPYAFTLGIGERFAL
jgi:hypothetical protein